MTLLEAMSASVPVVATAVGGHSRRDHRGAGVVGAARGSCRAGAGNSGGPWTIAPRPRRRADAARCATECGVLGRFLAGSGTTACTKVCRCARSIDMTAESATTLNPLVSVVVITYNGAEFVGHAIESVLQQSWQNLELIVVDDGSTDDTPDVIERFNDHASQVREAGRTRGRTRRGIAEFASRAVNSWRFSTADDWWLPDKICRQVAVARRSIPMPASIYSFAVSVDGSGEERARCGYRCTTAASSTSCCSAKCIAGSASSAMVRRRTIDTVGHVRRVTPLRRGLGVLDPNRIQV